MTDVDLSADTSVATDLAIHVLRPLHGLKIDEARASSIRPLVEQLLKRGAHLSRTVPPTIEPVFAGLPPRGSAV